MSKKSKIHYNPMKGIRYAERQQKYLVMCIVGIIALCFFLFALAEPAAAASSTGFGLSLASMALIGSIDDVTDRDTHGSEIAYQVVLIEVGQLADRFNFPQPRVIASGEGAGTNTRLVTIGKRLLKSGEAAHYFEAHTIPTLTCTSEKGDITTTGINTFVIVMGGDRSQLKNFIEEYSGGKFIILYKHVKDTVWHIIGEAERPMVLSSTEHKDDADGRYSTLTFTRNSVYLDCLVEFATSGEDAGATSETIQDLLAGNNAA